MLHDAGILTIYSTEPAKHPAGKKLKEVSRAWYGERTVGVTRYYTALQAKSRIDVLAEIEADSTITTNRYCGLQDGNVYGIKQVQHLLNEDGLRITLLSLEQEQGAFEIA